MKKNVICVSLMIGLFTIGTTVYAEAGKTGEDLFKKNCATCHPNGGNVMNPQKTLHKKDLEANGLTKASDLVKNMRNPGKGMPKFDKKKLIDKDAKKIAEYILKTFE